MVAIASTASTAQLLPEPPNSLSESRVEVDLRDESHKIEAWIDTSRYRYLCMGIGIGRMGCDPAHKKRLAEASLSHLMQKLRCD